jgi:hypothetical protein
MTKEKIWKIAKGLRKFSLDDLLMLSECEEQEVLHCIETLLQNGKISRLPDDMFCITIMPKVLQESRQANKEKREILKLQQISQIPFKPDLKTEIFDRVKEQKDHDLYMNAPASARRKAEKYLRVIQASKGLHGAKLMFFIKKWNETYPEMKTSYAAVMKAKKTLRREGKAGLLAKYQYGKGKYSCVSDEMYTKFRDSYLSRNGPTFHSCYHRLKEEYKKNGVEMFPSTYAFKRRLLKEFTREEIAIFRYGRWELEL